MNGNGKEMLQIYSDFPVLVDLIKLREDSRSTSVSKDQVMMLEQGLQFLVLYEELLSLFDDGVRREGKYLNLDEIPRLRATMQKEGFLETGELLEEIQSYKPSIWEDCFLFSDGLCNGRGFPIDFLLKFMRCTDISMANVLQLKGDNMIPDEKVKFEYVKEKLDMFWIVFDYLKESMALSSDFECALNAWVLNAAYLCLFYWVLDENRAPEGKVMLSKIYRNFEFPHQGVTEYCLYYLEYYKIPVEERCKVGEVVSPDVTRMCLSYLKASKLSTENRCKACAVVFRFIESLCWNLKVYLPNEATGMIRDGMMFLLTFVMDPPSLEANEGYPVLTPAQEALKKGAILIISLGSGERDEAGIVEATNFLLYDFCEMVITIKVEVRKTYSHLFLDPSFNFPRLNALHLFDSRIEYVKELLSSFPNHPISTIEKELVVLRDLLKASNLKDGFVLELQNEPMESKDLWTRISNVAHQADRVIRSYAYQDGLGLGILFLLDVQEEIKRLLHELKRIIEMHVQDSYTCRSQINSNPIVPLKSRARNG